MKWWWSCVDHISGNRGDREQKVVPAYFENFVHCDTFHAYYEYSFSGRWWCHEGNDFCVIVLGGVVDLYATP